MPDYVVGFSTLNHVAHLLSYNEYKKTPHKYESLEDYKKTLMHEVIHEVHDLFSGGNYTGPRPIWEGVAVYLSGQYNSEGRIQVSKEELTSHCDYKEYYYFFKEIIKTYDHETVLEILKGNIDGDQILDEILSQNRIK